MRCLRWMGLLLLTLPALAADVENGQTPKGKGVTLSFEEDLRLGPEKGEDYIWSGTKVVTHVDEKGRIFVMDPGENRIVMYDAEGKLVKSVGKQGPGPEEFMFMSTFSRLDNGFVVFENRQGKKVYTYLDKDLKITERKEPQPDRRFLQSAYLSPSGNYMACFWMEFGRDKQNVRTGLVDLNTNEPVNLLIDRQLSPFDQSRLTDSNWWSDYLSEWFSFAPQGQGVVAYAEDGSIYTATTDKYEITRWSPDLKSKLVFKRNYKPIPQSEEDIKGMVEQIRGEVLSSLPGQLHSFITEGVVNKAVEKAGFLPRKQPVFGIVPMGKNVLVIHDYTPKSGEMKVDIFNEKGEFIGVSGLPKVEYVLFGGYYGYYAKLSFRNGKAYGLMLNSDEDIDLVRYKVSIK